MKKGEREQCKSGQTPKEEYRNTASVCKDVVSKTKAQLELKLARDNKNNIKVSVDVLVGSSSTRKM